MSDAPKNGRKSRDATVMCDAVRIAHSRIASDVKKFFSLAMQKHISLIWNHRKMPEKPSVKILWYWPAMRKIGMFFQDWAMRNACDSDSRCGLACDASVRDAKSLAMWVERCEPLRTRPKPGTKRCHPQISDSCRKIGISEDEIRKLNKLKTTPTPNKNGSYGIKGGGSYAIKGGSVCHIFCRNPLILTDFYAIQTPFVWHILGAYFLQIWGVGVVRIIFRNGPNTVSESTVSNIELSEFFFALTEFRGENSVSSSQPIICVPKRTHRVFPRTHRVCPKTQWGSVSSLLRNST